MMAEPTALTWVYDDNDQTVYVDPRSIAAWMRATLAVSDIPTPAAAIAARFIEETARRLDDFATTIAIDVRDFGRGETQPGELRKLGEQG